MIQFNSFPNNTFSTDLLNNVSRILYSGISLKLNFETNDNDADQTMFLSNAVLPHCTAAGWSHSSAPVNHFFVNLNTYILVHEIAFKHLQFCVPRRSSVPVQLLLLLLLSTFFLQSGPHLNKKNVIHTSILTFKILSSAMYKNRSLSLIIKEKRYTISLSKSHRHTQHTRLAHRHREQEKV